MRDVNLIPARLVDRMPIRWWRPGNYHMFGPITLHFCEEHVRTIEINGRSIAHGLKLFPYDHEWEEGS